eukprot:5128659-Lingulodinium_polyedra.AAC.1
MNTFARWCLEAPTRHVATGWHGHPSAHRRNCTNTSAMESNIRQYAQNCTLLIPSSAFSTWKQRAASPLPPPEPPPCRVEAREGAPEADEVANEARLKESIPQP